jgi:CBS domain-containing protein
LGSLNNIRREKMNVSKVMTKQPKTIEPDRSIRFAAEVMLKYDIGALIVVDSFSVVGIITERDILRAFAKGMNPETEIKKMMTKKVISIGPEASLEDAAKLMLKHKIKRLPVCKDSRCFGIVTTTDLIKYEDKLAERFASVYLTQVKKMQAGY